MEDKQYLELQLMSKKLELNDVEVNRRIKIAEFNIKEEMLKKDIDSIKRQLGEG